MYRLGLFLKRYRRVWYGILTVFLALLLTAVCSAHGTETQLSAQVVGQDDVLSCQQSGYEVQLLPDGAPEFLPVGEDPQLLIPVSGAPVNKLTVRFAQPLPQDTELQLFYAAEGEALTEGHSLRIVFAQGTPEATFYLPGGSYSLLRLDVNGRFGFGELVAEEISFGVTYAFEPVPLIVFALLAVLLAVFDSRVGYFSAVRGAVCRIWACGREEYGRGRWRLLLYLLMWGTALLYALALFGLLLFSYVSRWSILLMVVLTVLAVAARLLWHAVGGRGGSPARLFFLVTVLIGFLFAYILPVTTMLAWDDQIHYYRSELISRTLLFHERSFADYGQAMIFYPAAEYGQAIEPTNAALLSMSQSSFRENGHPFNPYTYIAYLHQAFLIALSDWLSIDFILQMFVLKMANVLIYAFVIAAGIRRLKSGAYLFSAICLMPTCLFLASGINYDYWVTAFLTYALAVFLSEMQRPEQPLTRSSVISMLSALVLGCGPKAVYVVLGIPFLWMHKSKFRDRAQRRRYLRACLIVMAVVVLSFLLPFFVDMEGASDLRGGTDVNGAEQVKGILRHPLRYAGILLRFLGEYLSLGQATTYSVSFAYLGNASAWFATVALFLIAFCAFTDKSEADAFEGVGSFKAVSLLTCFVQLCLVASALYITFTPVGHETINGCQWRYLVPVLPLLLYCFGSCRVVNRMRERVMSTLVFGTLSAVLLGSVVTLYVAQL